MPEIPFIVPNVVDPVKELQKDLAHFFPELTHFYGYASTPDHNSRRCLDAMVYDSSGRYVTQQGRSNLPYAARIALGDRVNAFLRRNAEHYHLNGVIWNRHVWGFPHDGGTGGRHYSGPYGAARRYTVTAHDDHNHVELDGRPFVPLRPAAPWDGTSFPGAERFRIGTRGPWVTLLGQRLVAHGWTGYADGPGPEFTATDQAGVRWFQTKQGWTGDDANGFPGPVTWGLLMAAPPVAPPKPAPKPNPVPPIKEPTVPTCEKIAYLNLPGVGNWQGASLAGGYWYAVEARKQADGSEDCYVYRAKDGKDRSNITGWEPPMRINAAPGFKVHPTGWGVSDTGVLWLTANDDAEGNDIVTVQYVSGATRTKANCQEMTSFTKGNSQIAFDQGNSVASIRVVTTGYDTHVLRTKQDILDGKDRVLGKVRIPRRVNRVVQGFTVVKTGGDWELRVLVGLKSKNSPFGIERWSFATGKLIDTLPIPASLGREPEGIDGDFFGMKTEDRQGLDIYRYTTKEKS